MLLEKIKQKKEIKITKQGMAVALTGLLTIITCFSISDYEPGLINYQHKSAPMKEAVIPKATKSAGRMADLGEREKQNYNRKVIKKEVSPDLDMSSLPTGIPEFTTTPSLPMFPQRFEQTKQIRAFDPAMIYAHHVTMTDNMRNILSPRFKLEKLSKAPSVTDYNGRFITSYAINTDGNVSEKFELMSIVRSEEMQEIKTATDALNALIEESDTLNIIESTDEYLIYDFA